MKIQIKRFSTHQTAKVFALLMAASSLIFFVPFGVISMFAATSTTDGNAASMTPFFFIFLIMPIFQGVFGYLFIRLGLWVYNKLSLKIGGCEFELEELNS